MQVTTLSGVDADGGHGMAARCDDVDNPPVHTHRCARSDAVDEVAGLLRDRDRPGHPGRGTRRKQRPVGDVHAIGRHQLDHAGDVATDRGSQERGDNRMVRGVACSHDGRLVGADAVRDGQQPGAFRDEALHHHQLSPFVHADRQEW